MQYILTREEYDKLYNTYKERYENSQANLLHACKTAAELYIRNDYGWKGCVANRTTEYCDNCVVSNICPYERKHWGK